MPVNLDLLSAKETQLAAVFYDAVTMENALVPLFDIQITDQPIVRYRGMSHFGNMQAYDGYIPYDETTVGNLKEFDIAHYVKGFEVEQTMIEDAQFYGFEDMARQLAESVDRTVAQHMANVFNNGFADTGPDSQSLFDDAHPSVATTATQDNLTTAALSVASVSAARIAARSFTDDRGNPAPAMLDTIIIPPDLMETANTITQSVQRPSVANNDANWNYQLNVIVSEYLTSATAWFMVDSRRAPTYLKWFWRIQPDFEADPLNAYQMKLRYRARARWATGYTDWRWAYGSTGAG